MSKEFPYIEKLQHIAARQKVSVYLVGGYLRDYVLNRENHDFDFAVQNNALKLAKNFADQIKGSYILLDEDHGCARVVKKEKGKILTFDFADFRASTIEDDLKNRDFTINTLVADIQKLKSLDTIDDLIEDKKRALKDIQSGRIKRTSIKALRDDPLRMMRAFSLKAVLDFRIELSTLNQIKKEKDLLRDVSPERVRDELFKILESERTTTVLKEMDRYGLLSVVIPQIRIMAGCSQGGYHHLDVWPHSLEAVFQMEKILKSPEKLGLSSLDELNAYLNTDLGGGRSRRALMKLGCLLHDIGKPETRKKEGERYTFHGHEHAGQKIVKEIAKMLKLSTKERHALEDMVRWHLRPGYLSNFKKPSDRAVFRYFRDTEDESVSILLLSLADQRATRGPLTTDSDQKHHENICLGLVHEYFEKQKEEPFVPLINGNDLIKTLKLKPSPLFKLVLDEVEEQQVLQKIKTKTQAMTLARKLVKEKKDPE